MRRTLATGVAALSGLVAGFGSVAAPDLSCLEPQSVAEIDLGRSTGSIAASDGRLVSVSGNRVSVYDLSNPIRPSLLSAYTVPDELGYDGAGYLSVAPVAAIEGDIAVYALAYQDEFTYAVRYTFRALDLTDPTSPQPLASVPGRAQSGMRLQDGVLFLFGPFGLTMVDLAAPGGPAEIETPAYSNVTGLAADGDTLYLCDSDLNTGYPDYDTQIGDGFTVLDLSDPGHPVTLFRDDTLKGFSRFAVYGSHLLTRGPAGLTVFSIADPSSPAVVATLPEVRPLSIRVRGDTAIIEDETLGTVVVDVSDAAAPRVAAVADTDGVLRAFSQHYGYVSRGETLGVYDLDRLPTDFLPAVTRLDTPGYTREVHVIDGTALLADLTAGVRVVDIHDPAHPFETRDLQPGGRVYGVTVRDRVAFASAGEAGLVLIDVADPDQPAVLGTLPATWPGNQSGPGLFVDAAIKGDIAYIGQDTRASTLVADVSDPGNPVLLPSKLPLGKDLDLHGDRLFVANSSAGMAIVDVSDPASPVVLSEYPIGVMNAVKVVGDLAYYVGGRRLYIVDVSDPVRPGQVSWFLTGDAAREIDVRDGVAYIANEYDGLRLIDVSDPARPVGLATIPMPGRTTNVTVTDTHAYVSTEDRGMVIVELSRQCRRCAADLNGDAVADAADIQQFVEDVLSGHPLADLNHDGIVDLGDIQAFVAAFLAGC